MCNLTTNHSIEILIRCDGSPQLGLGHIVRCLALAMELRENHNLRLVFAMMDKGVGSEIVAKHDFPFFIKPPGLDEAQWINTLIQAFHPKVVILDVRTLLEDSALRDWRNAGIIVAVIDDPSYRRQAADLAFYPPVPQLAEVDWHDFSGKAFVGWDYILLRREFRNPRPRPENPIPVLLVTMGGSDPGGLTFLALKALKLLHAEFRVKVVLGRAFMHNKELDYIRPKLSNKFELLKDMTDMPSLMARCDFAIAAFGGTAYELAAVNVPSILLGLTRDHARSAESLNHAGMAINMGFHQHVSPKHLAASILSLLKAPHRAQRMSKACKALDGLGAKRIARIIFERINSNV